MDQADEMDGAAIQFIRPERYRYTVDTAAREAETNFQFGDINNAPTGHREMYLFLDNISGFPDQPADVTSAFRPSEGSDDESSEPSLQTMIRRRGNYRGSMDNRLEDIPLEN